MDACYDRERFPTLDEAIDWSWARTAEEIAAVTFVLSRFFTLTDGIYVQSHITEDLQKYHGNCAINAEIAKKREQNKKNRARTVDGSITNSEKNPPNHKPRTINQEPLTTNQQPDKNISAAQAHTRKNKNDYPDWFNELMLEYPPRAGSNDKRRAFQACNARIADGYTPDTILQAVTRYRFWVLATGKLNTEFVMQTATFCGPGGHLDNQWVIGSQLQPQVYGGGSGSTKATPIQQQLDDRSWASGPGSYELKKQESPLPGEFNLIQQQD